MKLVKSHPFIYGAIVGAVVGIFAAPIEPWYMGLAVCILFPIIFGLYLLTLLMSKE